MSRMTSAYLATGLLALGLAALAACSASPRDSVGEGQQSASRNLANNEVRQLTESLATLQQRLDRLESYQQGEASSRPLMPPTLAGRFIDVADLPVLGSPAARVVIVEVTDYQCPFCRTHFRETLPQLVEEFVDSGEVSYVVLDYPLPGHADAGLAAIAARCAGEQGRFWSYHDRLFEAGQTLGSSALNGLGTSLGLDSRLFQDCLARLQAESFVQGQRSLAAGLGVRGTPTFFIGRLTGGRVVTELTMLAGLQSLADFRDVIHHYLGS